MTTGQGTLTMAIKKWLTESNERSLKTSIFDIRRVVRRHPDTGLTGEFWLVEPPDWVNIVALTRDRRIVLVRQYRHGTDEVTLEIPGGGVDAGEDLSVAAQRELREETGYTCSRWEQIGLIEPNPAFMGNRCATLLGHDAELTHDTDFDEHEDIAVELYPVERFFEMIDEGSIRHGIVVSAAYYLMRSLSR